MKRTTIGRVKSSTTYRWSTVADAKERAAKIRGRGFDAVVRKVKHGFKVYAYKRRKL